MIVGSADRFEVASDAGAVHRAPDLHAPQSPTAPRAAPMTRLAVTTPAAPMPAQWQCSSGPSELRCHLRPSGHQNKHSTLWLSGPFTICTAPVATEAITAALSTGPWLVLDVDSLTRLDRVGLEVLIGVHKQLQELAPNSCVHLIGAANSPARRAVITSRLHGVLPVAASHPTNCPTHPDRLRASRIRAAQSP